MSDAVFWRSKKICNSVICFKIKIYHPTSDDLIEDNLLWCSLMIETEDLPSCGLIQHEDSPTKLSDGPIQDDDFMSDGLIKDEHDPLYGKWSIQG